MQSPCPWPIHGQQPQFYSNLLQQSSSYQQHPHPIHPNSRQFTLGPWPVPGQNDVIYGLKFPISSEYANRILKNREIVKKAREDDQNEKNAKFAVTQRNKNSSKIFLRPSASNHRRTQSQRTANTGRKIAAEGATVQQLNSPQKRVKLETIDEAETYRLQHSHYIESPSNLFTFEDTKPDDPNYGNNGSQSLLAYNQFPQHQIKPEESYVVQRPPSNVWHFDSGTVTNLYSPSMPKQTFYHGSYQVPMMTKLPRSYEAYQVSTMATAIAPKYAGNNTAVNAPLITVQNASTYNNRAPEFYHSQSPLLIAPNTHPQQTEQIQSYGQQRHTSATTKSAENGEAVGEDESWRSYLNLD